MESTQFQSRSISPENSIISPDQSELAEKDLPSLPVASLELLKHYTNTKATKRLRAEIHKEKPSQNIPKPKIPISPNPSVLFPAATIIKLAQAHLLQLKSLKIDIVSFAATSFGSHSGLPSGVLEDYELALRLLAAVEKVAKHHFVYARKLLTMCQESMSKTGNVVQKVCYYFAESLQERIDQEWGIFPSEELEKNGLRKDPVDVEQTMIRLEPEMMKCQQEIPFHLYTQFTSVQTILDCVSRAEKVHLIDFGINNGSHWTLIMQAFAARETGPDSPPFQHLKITAVGTSREMMEETGKWLTAFAENISLPFSFHIVVTEMKDLEKRQFSALPGNDETVAVFLGLRLWSLLPWPDHLEKFIRVIKSLNPSIIVVNEMEANINSPDLAERIDGAIVLIAAIFDCINSCMSHRAQFRKFNEEVIFPYIVRNIVTAEGRDWIQRFEKIGFWREVFGRFGIEETEMSRPPPSQEKMFLRNTLKQHDQKGKRLMDDNLITSQYQSAGRIMKLAKERLLQIRSRKTGSVSLLLVCALEALSDLPFEASEDLEQAFLLQAAAEKLDSKQWFQAQKLLTLCNQSASKSGNPVQRVVYYFAEALQEKINRECGILVPEEYEKMKIVKAIDVEQAEVNLRPEMMECQQEVPMRLASESTAIQAILDAVGSSRRIHLIDLGINNGSHWTLIMQQLAVRYYHKLESLKITAVGTCKEMLEATGNRLSSFAESLHLPFSFFMVVSELKGLKEDLFNVEADEAVAVYSEFRISTQLMWPNHLESLLGVIRGLNPRVVVVKEMEATINTQKLLERFDEALVLFSAMFDILKVCMEHQIRFRTWNEEVIFRQMIQNIVTAEGSQRIYRYERISFWRKLLAKFGMMETDFSSSSIYQANILLRSSSKFSSCTLNLDGKSLIFGWDGTSILSVSAWKFEDP
ncbi:OLC1v1020630C1 [Oldenlandia corymbosa var. corymbosa]|uniref:OLC1v1020630C1 n=1 Tax=Oldenlandia corymbosa var. corymbosa TaxID=529605 RepID=A0AAV1EH17_OLDCO|nr:OLC1v1020630C1 [Oldenlandia corymbosa var. corymbosa]